MATKVEKFSPVQKGEITRYYINTINETFKPEPSYMSHRESFDWFITSELAITLDRTYTNAMEKEGSGKTPKVKVSSISLEPVGKPEDCIKLHKTYASRLEVVFETNEYPLTEFISPEDIELPYMTPSCTFILYGREKIFINQLRVKDEIMQERKKLKSIPGEKTESDPYLDEHLQNKHVITIGKVLANAFEGALTHFYNIVRSAKDPNYRNIFINCLRNKIYYLFHKNDCIQPLDRLNPLSITSQFNMLTNMGRGGLDSRTQFIPRDVNNSYFCRLCPIETPEGKNCGLIHHLASYARIKILTGAIETPYIKIADKKLSWFTPEIDEQVNIAEAKADVDNTEKLLAKQGRTIKRYAGPDVRYKEVATDQMLSASASLIPFLEHDDGHRALMAANMQKQAVPLLYPEPPIVGTGREYQIAKDVAALNLLPPELSVKDGELALGKNLLVAYMPWYGFNYEDAIVISQELVDKDILTSVHINELTCTLGNTQALIEDKIEVEKFTAAIPNVNKDALDDNGVVRLNTEVRPRDILVGKLVPSPLASTPVSSSIFGGEQFVDASLYADEDTYGTVTNIRYLDINNAETADFSKAITVVVTIKQERKISLGDKLAGRHGNKGVVSVILPEEEMPYVLREDGTKEHVQVLLNPLGVPSRMNIGQLFEAHLGWVARALGTQIEHNKITSQQLKPYFKAKNLPKTAVFGRNKYRAIPFAAPAFNGPSLKDIQNLYKCAGLDVSCKSTLYNPITNKPYENPVTVGIAYMLKLDHLVDDKIHVRSTGRYTQLTEQPLQGRSNDGGQRLGEMEIWALEAHGAVHNLKECLTIKSDDTKGRQKAELALRKNEDITEYWLPESFKYLVKNLNALGFEIEIRDTDRKIMQIDEIAPTIK